MQQEINNLVEDEVILEQDDALALNESAAIYIAVKWP